MNIFVPTLIGKYDSSDKDMIQRLDIYMIRAPLILLGLLPIAAAVVPAQISLSTSSQESQQNKTIPIENDKPATASLHKQRGVSWVAGNKINQLHIRPLVANHINWIVQTPFGWQQSINSPKISLVTGGRVFWGETDEGLKVTAQLARQSNIRTLLKPHIWLRNKTGGKWRADIAMDSEEDWQQWFASYKTFILHYARFAEENDIEALCIGMELRAAVKARTKDWRQVIAQVRKVYHGKLTYAANWYGEFEEVEFWDDLDFIGIQGYFPLTAESNPTVEELNEGWVRHIAKIERIQKRYNRPVLFTEIGYRSTADAAINPWEWVKRGDKREIDVQTQARCYQAFFEAVWNKPWCAGAYWWKWHPTTKTEGTGNNPNFSPQYKPALKIMREWYSRSEE